MDPIASSNDASNTASDLLDRMTDYLIEHGLSDVSLRPMADALGVSTYKLVYHFGSKDEMVERALGHASDRQIAEVRSWLERSPSATVGDIMNAYWDWFLVRDHRAPTQLMFEANGLAARRSDGDGPLRAMVLSGIDFEERILERARAAPATRQRLATLICATCWGLQLDLLATGDAERTTATWRAFAADVDRQIATAAEGDVAM